MSLSIIRSRAARGVEAPPVSVQVHLSNGLPQFNIVGMPETAVKESRDRVRSAVITAGFDFPAKRITKFIHNISNKFVNVFFDNFVPVFSDSYGDINKNCKLFGTSGLF